MHSLADCRSLQVQAMVTKDETLALAASAADDKSARMEIAGGEAASLARSFSRVRMACNERSVAAYVTLFLLKNCAL